MILAPIGLIFVWIGWILAIQPAWRKIEMRKDSISTAGERVALITEIQNLEKRRIEMERLLATEETRLELLGKLTSWAKESGFELQSLTPNIQEAAPYDRLTFDLKAQANFPLLIRFLGKLENLKPGIAVHKMSVTGGQMWRRGFGSRGGADAPQIDLTLETYLKQK